MGTAGVGVAPRTIGVGLKMAGVRVGSANGVGRLFGKGCTVQPLQEAMMSENSKIGKILFISSPHLSLYPAWRNWAKSPESFVHKRIPAFKFCENLYQQSAL